MDLTPEQFRIACLISDDLHGRDIDAPLSWHMMRGMVEHLARIIAPGEITARERVLYRELALRYFREVGRVEAGRQRAAHFAESC